MGLRNKALGMLFLLGFRAWAFGVPFGFQGLGFLLGFSGLRVPCTTKCKKGSFWVSGFRVPFGFQGLRIRV